MVFLYDAFKDAFGETDPAVIFIYLLIVITFLWLGKEIRDQVRNDEEINRQLLEKTLGALSEILSKSRGDTKEGSFGSIYDATYGAFPYINNNLITKYLRILNDSQYPEKKKVQLIVDLTEVELISLSTLNKKLKTSSIVDYIEKYLNYFSRIISPYLISILLITLGVAFINVSNNTQNKFLFFANSVLLGLGIVLLILFLELIISKKLTPTGVLFFLGLLILDAVGLITNGTWSTAIILIILILAILSLFFTRLKYKVIAAVQS